MSSDKTGEAVAEYLHELELRLSGLPVLQRRELLADLEAHISNARVERGAVSEGEVLEILERLGSPEVVAAAAYEEAGILPPQSAGRRRPAAQAAPVFAYAGDVAAARPLPPVPPPPDAPPFAGPAFTGPAFAGPAFAEPPYAGGLPFEAPAPARPQGGSGAAKTIAIGAAIVLAVVVLLGCLAGVFLMRTSGPTDSGYTEAPSAVTPAQPADPPPPTISN